MRAGAITVRGKKSKASDSELLALERRIGMLVDKSDIFPRKAEELITRMWRIIAHSDAGRAAKVRVFMRHVAGNDFIGPIPRDLDWDIRLYRELLLDLAGMTEADLAALRAERAA